MHEKTEGGMTVELCQIRVSARSQQAILLTVAAASLLALPACGALAPLQQLIQPPRFEQAPNRPAEIRVVGPSAATPAGGAGVTLWLQVSNPNPFGFTLSMLDTMLSLEGNRAATGNFPFGLSLGAGQTSVIPIELFVNFADIPRLAPAVRQAARGQAIGFQLDGTVGIDAGRLGQPTFGPMLLMRGELRAAAMP